MNPDQPKPLVPQVEIPRPKGNGVPLAKVELEELPMLAAEDMQEIGEEDDLLETVPEPIEEPKVCLAQMVNETIEGVCATPATPVNGQSGVIPLTQPTIPPNSLERVMRPSNRTPVEELRLIAWEISGVIKNYRIIEKDLLAIMLVSRELKTAALETPNMSVDNIPPKKIYSFNEKVEHKIRDLRDGLYLILKLDGGGVFVYGGKQAENVDPGTVELTYKGMVGTREFFKLSDEIESGWAQEGGTPIDK